MSRHVTPTPDPLRPRPEVATMTPYHPPTEGRRGLLRLDFNENSVGCSPRVLEAVRDVTVEEVATYPEYASILKGVARALNLRPEQVLVTNGIDDAIRTIYWTYLNAGDTLLLPSPTFALFDVAAQVAGARIERVSYRPGTLAFPLEEVLSRLEQNPAPRLLVIVNPNNPTGTAVERADVERLVRAAACAGTLVLLDEAYHEFAGLDLLDLVASHDNLLVLRTFSKAYGLAGLRVGVVAGPARAIADIRKVLSPYGVNTLAVRALAAALEDSGHVRRYVQQVLRGRVVLQNGLDGLGIEWKPSRANFLLARFGAEAARVHEALRDEGVLVRDRSRDPLTRGCLRLGVGTPDQCRRLLGAIVRVFQNRAILFDMDGVLVDVSRSYRAAIAQTTEALGGGPVSADDIHRFKNEGCHPDDWVLTQAILKARGVEVPLRRVRRVFQGLYLGQGGRDGLREQERWLLPAPVLSRLARRYPLGIVTARPKAEALWTLKKFDVERYFRVVVAREDVGRRLKPDPHGLLLAQRRLATRLAAYIGDSTSDMRAAVAAGHFAVGCITPGADPQAHARALREAGADEVVARIEDIESPLRRGGRRG